MQLLAFIFGFLLWISAGSLILSLAVLNTMLEVDVVLTHEQFWMVALILTGNLSNAISNKL